MADFTPPDFLAGLGGIANLPAPYDVSQQVAADQQRQQSNANVLQQQGMALTAAQQQQRRAQQYQTDVQDALKTGQFAGLYAKYPEQQKELQAAHDALDKPTQDANKRDLFAVRSFITNGSLDSAKALLQKRVDADKAAGLPADEDQQMLDAINSGNQHQVKAAADMALYAILPEDKRAEIFGKQTDKTHVITAGGALVDDSGAELYRAPTEGKTITVKNADGSESVVAIPSMGGGGPASAVPGLSGASIETAALAAIPGLTVTSRARTPEHNKEVGGVPNSYHLTDQARDFVPPSGMSLTQLAVNLKQAIPGAKIIKESDHVHVQPLPPAKFNEAGTRVLYTSKGNPGGASGNAPSGYRYTANGTLEPIPGGPADAEAFSKDTITTMAQQYLAGDKSVLQGLGRGKQGAAAIAQVRTEVARLARAQGMGGADIAAQMTDFAGTMAAQRAAGTRIAQVELASTEAQKLIPLALSASEALPRNGFLPFSRAEQALSKQKNNPALRRFVTANNALVNVYSRAVSPTGAPTVSDKEHARELLDTAYDQPSYRAVVEQMQQEIQAARDAPKDVRRELHASVSTNGGAGNAQPVKVASLQQAMALKPGTPYVRPDGKRMIR